ncbi:NAD/FAD-utilizing enzyme [Kineobactrum salinum]|uniref:NAD/FAD-utilizing enzyme n=1 Tax=Kineobactrum salinum TaxID=2708301 RepID=A0A6C0U003_9GAMM|nr:NAD/FAD-utilizing enzyme [Kineobactrum salinum]QIB65361.1 NAD/FAD-utilizing enzyme [Kineobactrum salinum]
MKRHFFLSEDLDDLELVEQDLEKAGVSTPQIHVLSEDDAGVQAHHLNDVEAVLRKDVVHGTERGAVIGVVGAAIVLGAAWATGIPETITWVPPLFLAIVILGFCTWEGGLIGIQEPHSDFKRFQEDLRAGRHVLFVDVRKDQEEILHRVAGSHSKLTPAGEGPAAPGWFLGARQRFDDFMKTAP